MLRRAVRQPGQPAHGGLEEAVGWDVGREFVVPDLDGNRDAIAPAQLVFNADAAADDVQRFFLGHIVLKQTATGGLADCRVE